MKTLKITCVSLAFIGTSSFASFGQQATVSSGGDVSATDGSVSYSVGQVVVQTLTDGTFSVAPGVQQPYEVSEFIGLYEIAMSNLELSAFPNPTTDGITLGISNYADETLSYVLLDASGRKLQESKIFTASTVIDLNSLQPATYFLRVDENASPIKTFKIIKR